tara:strand:+ start:354 stop:1334 length:981 start_codon:yes stop_codon:yes gene_type:complete
MSNFSQYFPASSGGGSGGTPINGYTPFLVTGTGNPSGYDATTGLYTHPDGTFWIATGNQIVSTVYPNATGVSAIGTSTGTTWTSASEVTTPVGITWNGSNFYVGDSSSNIVYEYTAAGTYTGTSFNTSGQITQLGAISWDDSSSKFIISDNPVGNVDHFSYWYTAAGAYTGTSVAMAPTGNENLTAVAGDESNNLTFMGSSLYGRVRSYNTTADTLINNLSNPGGFQPRGFAMDQANLSFYNWDRGTNAVSRIAYTAAGGMSVADLNLFTVTTGAGNGLAYDGTYFYAQTDAGVVHQLNGSSAIQVGDATVRTDTDTSQPLFIRVK